MSEVEKQHAHDGEEPESQGPSLTLLYSLIGLALLAAIAAAAMIVLPFYHQIHP